MRSSEARAGRVFVVRLEHGEVVHEAIERFAVENEVLRASVIALGALDGGSALVVGPVDGNATPVVPMRMELPEPRELAGVGTIFPDEKGVPVLHMHVATGRKDSSVTGCVRAGVRTWKVLELIVQELVDNPSVRRMDPVTGFELLEPEP